MRRLLPFLVLIIFITFLAFALTRPVRHIDCKLVDNSHCPESITGNLNKVVGLPQWRFSEELKKTMQSLEEVERYSSKITTNGSIVVTIALRPASIALRADGTSTLTLYSENGLPAGEATETNLPIVTIREQINPSHIPFIATLAQELSKLLTVKQMDVAFNSLVVITTTDLHLTYPLEGDIDKLLGATVIVFSQLNETQEKLMIRDTTIKEVDFRYNNPVLRSGGN